MLKFELSLEEANAIVAGLSKLSYEVAAPLIAKLQSQAAPQLEAPKKEEIKEKKKKAE